jgi:DNA polymerase-4
LPEIYRAVTPAVEEVAPGAAYIDLSGLEPLHGEPVRQIAQHVVDRATWELGLPLVGGLARNKVLACLAARHARPGQVFELAKDQEQQFLDAEPLGALPGMGRPAVTLLRDYGVGTVGDFGRLSEGAVVRLLGARARRLLAWARGEDSRPVRAGDRSDVEQSAAVTFPRDTLDYTAIVEAAHSLTDQLLFRVRRQSRLARVVWVRVTHSDLQEARTLCHLGHSTSLYPEVHRAVDDLLRCVLARRVRIRQLEIGLGRFVADQRQQSLFPNRRDRLAQLCWSVDEVWSKHGRIVLFGDDPSLRRGWV